MSERTRDYRVTCLSEALAPITHMAGVSGNEAIVAREPVATDRGVRWVPVLSGNALRHRCVRAPGMDWLVREYGLSGKLSLAALNFLFHGGSLTEGGGREDTRRIADFQRLWPLGRLLGGSLPDQILAGSLHSWRGALVCEENRVYLSSVVPDPSTLPGALRPAESFVSGYQYTRGDAAKGRARDLVDLDAQADSNLMIFAGQAIVRGAVFVHGFALPHASEAELGALLWSLSLWQAGGGTVGGQAARGHGRLRLYLIDPDFDADAAIAVYLDHARCVKDEAVAWLEAAFAPRGAKKAAKGRGKAEEADDE